MELSNSAGINPDCLEKEDSARGGCIHFVITGSGSRCKGPVVGHELVGFGDTVGDEGCGVCCWGRVCCWGGNWVGAGMRWWDEDDDDDDDGVWLVCAGDSAFMNLKLSTLYHTVDIVAGSKSDKLTCAPPYWKHKNLLVPI